MMTATLRKSRTMDILSQPNQRTQVAHGDQIMQKVLKCISEENYDFLRQRDHFRDLSFTFPAGLMDGEEEGNRKTASKLVNFLQGTWKFNYGHGVQFFIVSRSAIRSATRLAVDQVVTQSSSGLPLHGLSAANMLAANNLNWLLPETRERIIYLYTKEVQIKLKREQQIAKALGKSPSLENLPTMKTLSPAISKIMLSPDFSQKLKQFSKSTQRFGRVIDITDFLNAAMILRSGYPDFHNERIHTLFLAEDQKRPERNLKDGSLYRKSSMFVVSTLDNPKLNSKQLIFQLESHQRQVFHEFEKDPDDPQRVQIYKLHLTSEPIFNVVATDVEIKYCNNNLKEFRRMRDKQLAKDLEMYKSETNLAGVTDQIQMPLPSHQHCGVCGVNYEDYTQHIESQEHKSQINVHKNFYDFIDRELEDLNCKAKNKRWKTSPPRVKQIASSTSKVGSYEKISVAKNDASKSNTEHLLTTNSTNIQGATTGGTSQVNKSSNSQTQTQASNTQTIFKRQPQPFSIIYESPENIEMQDLEQMPLKPHPEEKPFENPFQPLEPQEPFIQEQSAEFIDDDILKDCMSSEDNPISYNQEVQEEAREQYIKEIESLPCEFQGLPSNQIVCQLPLTEIKEKVTMEANVTSLYQTAQSQTSIINLSRPLSDINSMSNSQLDMREISNQTQRLQTPAPEDEVSSNFVKDRDLNEASVIDNSCLSRGQYTKYQQSSIYHSINDPMQISPIREVSRFGSSFSPLKLSSPQPPPPIQHLQIVQTERNQIEFGIEEEQYVVITTPQQISPQLFKLNEDNIEELLSQKLEQKYSSSRPLVETLQQLKEEGQISAHRLSTKNQQIVSSTEPQLIPELQSLTQITSTLLHTQQTFTQPGCSRQPHFSSQHASMQYTQTNKYITPTNQMLIQTANQQKLNSPNIMSQQKCSIGGGGNENQRPVIPQSKPTSQFKVADIKNHSIRRFGGSSGSAVFQQKSSTLLNKRPAQEKIPISQDITKRKRQFEGQYGAPNAIFPIIARQGSSDASTSFSQNRKTIKSHHTPIPLVKQICPSKSSQAHNKD